MLKSIDQTGDGTRTARDGTCQWSHSLALFVRARQAEQRVNVGVPHAQVLLQVPVNPSDHRAGRRAEGVPRLAV